MAQNAKINVTSKRCPAALKAVIDVVNAVYDMPDVNEIPNKKCAPGDFNRSLESLCRCVHEIAQIASLPVDMREDYAKVIAGTAEEWERFCRRLPARLWRKWPSTEAPIPWRWPRMTVELVIDDDGRIGCPEEKLLLSLVGVEVERLRECRGCQRIFWARRIEKTGAPYGCCLRCNNTLRQRSFQAERRP